MANQPRLKVEYVPTESLVPYVNNAKKHPDWQVNQIAESIKQFGNCDPIGVWHNESGEMEVVEGHGRLMALKNLGIEKAPIIALDHLDDDARRAYAHVHNQLTMNTEFDMNALNAEIERLNEFDWESFGFELNNSWFERENRFDKSREEGNEEYNEFLDKFEQKKTTDDCYTPELVYEAVAGFVSDHYGVRREDMVRPFYPGGDYENEKYPDGCCVVDNPPFSILAQIVRFYNERGIRFFMFAPALTLFGSARLCCAIACGVAVTYENGAKVSTSFVTNLEDAAIHTMPELYELVSSADEAARGETSAHLTKYEYPDEVITAARAGYLAKYGQEVVIGKSECKCVPRLDMQTDLGIMGGIFGSGYLLSEKAAAEKAAAENAKPQRVTLSEREREIVRSLGGEP